MKKVEKIGMQWLSACLLGATLSIALATQPLYAQDGSLDGRAQILGANYQEMTKGVVDSQARVVVYRLRDVQAQGAATVYVNGMYHASLVSGAHAQPLCLPAGSAELGVRRMNLQTRPNADQLDSTSVTNLQGGKTLYLQVLERRGHQVLVPVAAEQAKRDLQNSKLQTHTLSRVLGAQVCEEKPDVVVQAVPAQSPSTPYMLTGDTLFAFNRSDRAGLTGQGLQQLDNLKQRLRAEYRRVDRLHVVGHADPMGSPEINEPLSLARAITVRDYLTESAPWLGQGTAQGRGSQELVVSTCGASPTPFNLICNQPNRRVVVNVYGERR